MSAALPLSDCASARGATEIVAANKAVHEKKGTKKDSALMTGCLLILFLSAAPAASFNRSFAWSKRVVGFLGVPLHTPFHRQLSIVIHTPDWVDTPL